MISVGYLGPPASFSHQATLRRFPPSEYDLVPCVTIADVFHSVQSGTTDFGVVPVENSTNGAVVYTLDLLCDRERQFGSLRITAEEYLPVHLCLVGVDRPEISRDYVDKIYSHPQAFGQCERFLSERLKGVEYAEVSSTSKAAELAASDHKAVAISSKIAVEVHAGIKVLREDIEDKQDNTTRFLVLTKEGAPSAGRGEDGGDNKKGAAFKTFLTFTIMHKKPGALCDALRVFKDFDMDLTSISSRPSKVIPWNYIFLVEFEGHEAAENVQKALVEMRKFCLDLRILGSYENIKVTKYAP